MPELVCAATDPQWLAERRKGVTATDITAIIGISPYESAYSLYYKKLGIIPDEHTDSDRMRLGRELEPVIRDRWCEASGNKLWTFANHLWRSTARTWQLATPDCVVGNELAVEPVELKSWADAGKPAWDDEPPPIVRAQVLWQMDTLDVATGHVGVLFLPSGEFRSYVVKHGPGKCSTLMTRPNASWGVQPEPCQVCADIELMRMAARDFLDRIDLRDPPPLDGSSATLAALRARFPAHKGKEAEIDAELWMQYEYWANQEATDKRLKQSVEAAIREQLGEATILTVNGTKVGTRVISRAEVKAHTRHQDYIRRTTRKENQ